MQLKNYIGEELEDNFFEFDLTEIQEVLNTLADYNPIDIAHAEMLQQKCLRGADILSEYLGKIIKTSTYLESQVNVLKNKAALNYKPEDGVKITADMRKFASEISPEVEQLQIRLSRAKASKILLEKKYEILIKLHHHWKDIAMGMRKTILGNVNYTSETKEKTPSGWE